MRTACLPTTRVSIATRCQHQGRWCLQVNRSPVLATRRHYQGRPCTVSNKFEHVWGSGPGVGGPLHSEVSCRGARARTGLGSPFTVRANVSWLMVTWDLPPVDRHTHDWKHYLLTTALAGGNKNRQIHVSITIQLFRMFYPVITLSGTGIGTGNKWVAW